MRACSHAVHSWLSRQPSEKILAAPLGDTPFLLELLGNSIDQRNLLEKGICVTRFGASHKDRICKTSGQIRQILVENAGKEQSNRQQQIREEQAVALTGSSRCSSLKWLRTC